MQCEARARSIAYLAISSTGHDGVNPTCVGCFLKKFSALENLSLIMLE